MNRRPLSQIQVHSLQGECFVIILFTYMDSHYKKQFLLFRERAFIPRAQLLSILLIM